MVGRTSDWKEELRRFLKPFLDRLGHKASMIAHLSSATLLKTPRRMRFRLISAKKRSTMLSQEAEVVFSTFDQRSLKKLRSASATKKMSNPLTIDWPSARS
jgi:glycerophosphoryl diester phosphodiesterase